MQHAAQEQKACCDLILTYRYYPENLNPEKVVVFQKYLI